MTPYVTPAELAAYIDPDAETFPPATLTWPTGYTLALSRSGEIITAVLTSSGGAASTDTLALPPRFQPFGTSRVLEYNDPNAPACVLAITDVPALGTLGASYAGQMPAGEVMTARWVGEAAGAPLPPLASVLLRSAQSLILDTIAGATYATDSNEHATDARTRTAIREAIMEQASAWSLYSVDPRKGAGQAQRQVASKSLLGGSVSYVADPARDTYLSDLASGYSLTYSAWLILRNAGLISNRVATASGVETFNIAQRAYDPVTGVLEP